jgi:hypothetical protein
MIVIAFALSIAWPAAAGDLTVKVVDGDGKPVSDAIVTVTPNAPSPDSASVSSKERPASISKIVDQESETFLSHVQVFRSGADGQITVPSLATGAYTPHLWHPQLHPGRPEIVRAADIEGNTVAVPLTPTLALIPDPRMRIDRERLGS